MDGANDDQISPPKSEVSEPPNWPVPDVDHGDRNIFGRLFHWGPLIALTLIGFIGFTTAYYMMMWWPLVSIGGVAHFSIYLFWTIMTVENFMKASSCGAGYVPRGWAPNEPALAEKLQKCKPCGGYKAPRSHHCSRCQRCCMKMDHHCPWINNCVGHVNHGYFIRFLAAAIIGCTHSAIVLIICVYHAFQLHYYLRYGDGTEPIVVFEIVDLLLVVMASAAAVAVAIALTVLLFFQLKYVFNNKNSIEEYIFAKAQSRREDGSTWIYPYNVGWKRNVKEVLSSWSGKVKGNGFWWPVRSNCDQFTFTEEQLEQKAIKKQFAREIVIMKEYNGGRFETCKFGKSIFMRQPIVDGEPIKVKVGEKMVATRGSYGWVYCYRAEDGTEKGWVPRAVTNLLTPKEAEPYREQMDEEQKEKLDEMLKQEQTTTKTEDKKNQ